MVLDSLFNPRKLHRKPWEMFFVGLVYSSLAIVLSLWIFTDYTSLVMIFFTVLACGHIVYGAIELAEYHEDHEVNRRILFKDHTQTLMFLVFLFLGFLVSFSLWYTFLPAAQLETVFGLQTATIQSINGPAAGAAVNPFLPLSEILWKNFKILLLCALFAFAFGVGAIFILTWNASIIGTAVGNLVRESIGGSYFTAFPLALARYLTHGIFEISAFFLAGMAGGIISIAIIKHEWNHPRFKRILWDSLDLFIISVIMIVFAGLVEVFITAAIFG